MFYFTSYHPDFWIQLKGNNAGMPLRKQTVNSIGVKTNKDVLNPDYLFYTILYLFNIGAFQKCIKGSVIPYIRQGDITITLINHWIK